MLLSELHRAKMYFRSFETWNVNWAYWDNQRNQKADFFTEVFDRLGAYMSQPWNVWRYVRLSQDAVNVYFEVK